VKKKYWVILLEAVLALAMLLQGCNATTGPAQQTTQPAAPPATPEPQARGYSFPYTGEKTEISFLWVDFGYEGRTYDKTLDSKFKEALGNIEWNETDVAWSDYNTKMDIMLSTGEMPDIAIMGSDPGSKVRKYGGTGVLLDYSKYLDLLPNYVKMAETFPQTYLAKTAEGNIFALDQPYTEDNLSEGWQLNNYYLVKTGLKAPETLDELYQYLKAVKALNPDSTPFIAEHAGYTGHFYAVFNTSNSIYMDPETKQWAYGPYKASYKSYLEYMHKLYADKLVDPEYMIMPDDKLANIMFGGPDGWALYNGYFNPYDADIEKVKAQYPDFDFTFMLPPKADGNAKRWMIVTDMKGAPDSFAIMSNAKTKNPELVCSLINYCLSDEIGDLVNWGIKGVTYDVVNGEKKFNSDLKMASNPAGTVDPRAEYGLMCHRMIKQGGLLTKNDKVSDDLYAISPRFRVGYDMYANYAKQDPSSRRTPGMVPVLDQDESNTVSQIITALDTYVEEESLKFITGARDLSEYDDFISKMKDIGDPQTVLDIYNSKPAVVVEN
jgi:putative aldouronate transport system substrate-binding protein